MAALPLPVAILDDIISGSANEVIQDGGRKRKGRHFPPPPQWGSKKPPYTTHAASGPLSGSATSAPTPSGDDGGWQSAGASLWVYMPGNHGTRVGC